MYKSKIEHLQFSTRLSVLPNTSVSIPLESEELPAQLKKRARLEISLQNTNEQLGFLHAVLIEMGGKFYLLAGESGVGKSTYARALQESCGAQILANDWVAVEKEGPHFYASDLNFTENLQHTERCQVDGVIFLTKDDLLQRDACVPNQPEYLQLLRSVFDSASDREFEHLAKFWLENRQQVSFSYAVAARAGTEKRVADTITSLLKKDANSRPRYDVGVIGLGSLGALLAFELGQLPLVEQVHLFNRSPAKTYGLALDMNQGHTTASENTFRPHEDPRSVFESSEVVFLTFRDTADVPYPVPMPERWKKLPTHLHHIQEYAGIASETRFNGAIFVITNPVDILTYALYMYSQDMAHPLRTYQTYGVGLEVDISRALHFGKNYNPSLRMEDIQIYGNHSDEFLLQTPLPPERNAQVLQDVQQASEEIRKSVSRTIYGPVNAAKRNLLAYLLNQPTSITMVQEGTHIGRKIEFQQGLPMLPDDQSPSGYDTLIQENKARIDRYLRNR